MPTLVRYKLFACDDRII